MGFIEKVGFNASALLSGLALSFGVAADVSFDSELGIQMRVFTENYTNDTYPTPDHSKDVTGAIRYKAEFYTEWNDGADSFEFVPWIIWDSQDEERRHADIQDLAWIHVADEWELRTGIRKVFWGVVESQHRVDIINQTDATLNPNGEEKLGQPMINLSMVRDWGILDLFVLVGHRERIMPGEDDRFQSTPLPVEWDNGVYEAGGEENRVDFAFRWQHSYGDWEWALSHFSGTSRDPLLGEVFETEIVQVATGNPFMPFVEAEVPTSIRPYYTTIDQTGLEIQYIWEGWIFKGEFISNSGYDVDRYTAGTLGFEYTQVGIFETAMDFGWLAEYSGDDRGDRAFSTAEHDVFLGGRLSFNDADSSEVVMGVNLDIETDEQVYVLELSKRVAESVKIVIDAFVITGSEDPVLITQDSKTSAVSRDDYVQIEAVYYF